MAARRTVGLWLGATVLCVAACGGAMPATQQELTSAAVEVSASTTAGGSSAGSQDVSGDWLNFLPDEIDVLSSPVVRDVFGYGGWVPVASQQYCRETFGFNPADVTRDVSSPERYVQDTDGQLSWSEYVMHVCEVTSQNQSRPIATPTEQEWRFLQRAAATYCGHYAVYGWGSTPEGDAAKSAEVLELDAIGFGAGVGETAPLDTLSSEVVEVIRAHEELNELPDSDYARGALALLMLRASGAVCLPLAPVEPVESVVPVPATAVVNLAEPPDALSGPLPADTCGVPGPVEVVDGSAVLDEFGSVADTTGMSASGDLDGDGVDDVAFVVQCAMGPASVFPELVLEMSGGTSWRVSVEAFDADATVPPGGFLDAITAVSVADGVVTVSWVANTGSEPLCCPSVEGESAVAVSDGRVVVTSLRR
jgi:hypothetical protein